MLNWQTIKNYIKSSLDKVQVILDLILGLVIFVLYVMFKTKDDELNKLKAQIEMAKTVEEVNNLQTDINNRLKDSSYNEDQANRLIQLSKELEEKKKSIDTSNMTPDQVEQYYNKGN